MKAIVLLILLATPLYGVMGPNLSESEGEMQAPMLERALTALTPQHVLHLPIREPKARYLVRVDRDGTVADYVCLEASHPELLRRGAARIERAVFKPATMNGEPIVADTVAIVHFTDPTEQYTVVQSGLEHIESMLYEMRPGDRDAPGFRESGPNELDAPLELVDRKDQYKPVDDEGEPVLGKAVISGYVDHEGRVRMVRVHSSEGHEAVEAAALQSFLGWRFEPPKRDGDPTVVPVRMPFVYR